MLTVRNLKILISFIFMVWVDFAFAGGGLKEATTQVTDIKTWAYGFLGVCVFIYLIYKIVMALFDKILWSEVLMAVGVVAASGACLAVGEWAWGLWGT